MLPTYRFVLVFDSGTVRLNVRKIFQKTDGTRLLMSPVEDKLLGLLDESLARCPE